MLNYIIIFFLCLTFNGALISQDTRPNIIFILTDDQRWDALGFAGNEIIQTPEMDKLAAAGTYFKNAFVTTPICAASRASIITGLYERKHRFTFQQPPLKKEFVDESYFSILKKAGYYNGFLGKMGIRFEENRDTSLFDYYKPENQNHYYKVVEGVHKHVTNIIGDNAVDFINSASRDQPFCLSISFHAPHAIDDSPDQYVWAKEVDELYQEVDIPDPHLGEDRFFDLLPLKVRKGFNRVRWKWRYDTPEKYQKMVKGYYRMISGVDNNIGKIRKALEENGVSDNTVIILMGDNGYFLGERQLAGKWLMYEESLRVPLIIFNPQVKENHIVNDMALNIDIAPTILDFANTKTPDAYQGISLKAYTEGELQLENKRNAFLCEHLWDFEPIPPSEGVRTEQYKYFRYIDDPDIEELYDLTIDPDETNNLRFDPGSRRVLEAFRIQCDQLITWASE